MRDRSHFDASHTFMLIQLKSLCESYGINIIHKKNHNEQPEIKEKFKINLQKEVLWKPLPKHMLFEKNLAV